MAPSKFVVNMFGTSERAIDDLRSCLSFEAMYRHMNTMDQEDFEGWAVKHAHSYKIPDGVDWVKAFDDWDSR